jgi:hypothetical protein
VSSKADEKEKKFSIHEQRYTICDHCLKTTICDVEEEIQPDGRSETIRALCRNCASR